MNPLGLHKSSKNFNAPCSDLQTMGERELSAFFNATTQLFGPELAQLSAEDWLHELIETNVLPTSSNEWRLITAKVSIRLASRVSALSLTTQPQIA